MPSDIELLYLGQTEALLRNDSLRMRCLLTAQALNLPDWYLGAGFVRNAIWDHLHHKTEMTPLNDVDLVFFDPTDVSPQREQALQEQLIASMPEINWEVRNQARMHEKHGHAPYRSTAHGIAQWVEVPTCVGVRLEHDGRLTFCAPYGLRQNWSLTIAINPCNRQPEIVQRRILEKKWLKLWPHLHLI